MTIRERVLAATDWDTSEIEAGAWGTLTIRSFSAREKLELADTLGDNGELSNTDAAKFYCRLIVLSVIDADSNPAFTESDVDDLLGKNWNTIEKVSNAVREFNGMAKDSIEGTAKN